MKPRRVRLLVVVIAAMIAVAAVAIAWPWVRVYTGSAPPDQFYRALPAAPDTGGREVLGVAHNAGNNPKTTARALAYGADVIEIDVMTVHGHLAAGRAHAVRWLAERVFRGETLAQAWRHAAPAQIIKLDLQQTDHGLLDSLVSFLHGARSEHPLMISTRDAGAIEYLRPRLATGIMLLFSVPFPDAVARIQGDPTLTAAVGGISVFQGLVSSSLVTWAHERRLSVLAWTVNDGERLDQLLALHVDGVTTANLAIIRGLSG